jgi:hypothetical protein
MNTTLCVVALDLDDTLTGSKSKIDQRMADLLGDRCRWFGVDGDVTFGAGVVAVGDIRVAGPRHVPDNEVLGG